MKIAILGFGIVGSGTYEVLACGDSGIEVKRILDIRKADAVADKITHDINDIINDDEIDTVVETMGGIHPTYEYVTAAMKAGKNVVSSNKMLVATYYEELVELARENGVEYRFTASSGGAIPWLSNVIRRTHAEKIMKLQAIINGTTNFILDSMQTRGADFAEVLAEAQALGYAERDPSSDIDGEDVKFKCSITSSCAFGVHVPHEAIDVLSLRTVKKSDMDYAAGMGMTLRYMTFAARKENGAFTAYVEPSLIPMGCLESSVHLNNNMISLFGDVVGRLSFYGQGAGKYPTGASVAYDIIEIATKTGFGAKCAGKACVDNGLETHRYFVRSEKKLPCVEAIAQTCEEKDGAYYTVTNEVSVAQIHAIAKEAKALDAGVFFAGIHPEV